LCRFLNCLFKSVLSFNPIINGEGWDAINIIVSVLSQDLDIQQQISWSYLF
jgi:hypothetical protein